MLWGQLLDRVLVGFPPEEVGILTNAAKQYLIDAQEDFALHTECLEKEYAQSISADTKSVTLPTDLISLGRVEWRGNVLEPTSEFSRYSFKNTDDSWIYATPDSYFIKGDTLFLTPGASQSGKLTMWYSYRPVVDDPATMAAVDFDWSSIQDDEPSIPKTYHQYLADFARSQIYWDKGDDTSASRYLARYLANRDVIAGKHANRFTTGPTTVLDVMH